MTTNTEVQEYTSKSGTEIHAVFDTVKFGDLHMVKYAVQRDVANVHVMGRVDPVSLARGKRQTTGACVFTIFQKDRLLEAINKGAKDIFLTNHELVNYGNPKQDVKYGKLLTPGSRRYNTINPDAASALTPLTTEGNTPSIFDINTYGGQTKAALADQVPPFDITLVGISEVDPSSTNRMIIHGVQFTSDQGGTSIDDLVLERQLTFLARRISPWTPLADLAVQSTTNNTAGSLEA